MPWDVRISLRASRDLEAIAAYIGSSAAALRWYEELLRTIESLEATPRLGKRRHHDPSSREVIYGHRPHLYRIIYDLDEANKIVVILTVWHSRRRNPSTLR